MSIDRMTVLGRKLFLLGAFALLAVAVIEKIANLSGQTVIRASYLPSQLADYAVLLLLFGIALLLAEILKALKKV